MYQNFKTFDKVWYNGIISELKQIGLSDNILTLKRLGVQFEIFQLALRMQKFYFSILTIYFCKFFGFFTFPCYKETNEVSIQQMASAFFFIFNLLLKICLTIVQSYIDIRLVIQEIWSGDKFDSPKKKSTFKKPSRIRFKLII